MPLGARRAFVLTGAIWGVWHWPVIAMGHNWGLDYPGVPWLGMLAMVWFTFLIGTFLGWATLRSGSVWPAVIGHGAINGIAGIAMLFARGRPNPLLGPVIHYTLVLDEVRGQPGLHHPPLLEHVGPSRGGKRRVGVASDRVR